LHAAQTAIARRAAGEPVAYILGEREFYGLRFRVDPAVLIPRPETEHLVEFAIAHAPQGATVADIGCGSGSIAIALAHARPDLLVIATDVSAAALQVARANALALGVAQRVTFMQGDLLAPLAQASCAVVVSNPPYIAAGDAHLAQGDLRFEPTSALTDGADGLALLRKIAADAPRCLTPGGWLAVEHGHDQGAAVMALFQAAGLEQVATTPDLAGIPRNTVGQRPPKP
jgi:release factor glutamine methyltransferase